MGAVLDKTNTNLLDEICRKHHVRRLSLFGSVAREQARPDSDVDLLVEYENDYVPTYFKIVELGDALSPIFAGRYVDLVFPGTLHWFIRDEVLASAQAIYER
jgi:hypothetical protein